MRKSFFKITFLILMLIGCSSKIPSDKIAWEGVKLVAYKNILPGIRIVDENRKNGWFDSNSTNLYIVVYSYNYQIFIPFNEAVIQNAKLWESTIIDEDLENIDIFSNAYWALEWINSQGSEAYHKRIKQLFSDCQFCIDYYYSDLRHRYTVALSIKEYEEKLNFGVNAKKGDKTPFTAQAGFLKTENGWERAN